MVTTFRASNEIPTPIAIMAWPITLSDNKLNKLISLRVTINSSQYFGSQNTPELGSELYANWRYMPVCRISP